MKFYQTFWAISASAAILAACTQPASNEGDQLADTTPEAPAERQIVEIDPNNDPRVWLEEVEGEQAIEWVEGQNERTFARLQGDERYQGLYDQALAIAQSEDRIPYGSYSGGYIWNFWQDAEHTHGL